MPRGSRSGLVVASVRAGVRQPVVLILLLAGLFDDLAGNGIHSIPLAFTAAAGSPVFVALGLWELTNLLLQPSLTTDSQAHPTLSVLTDPVLGSHLGRSIGLALWLGLGWFLVRR